MRLEPVPTFHLEAEGHAIMCHRCGRTSFHPEDVRRQYCGACSMFHELAASLLARWRSGRQLIALAVLGFVLNVALFVCNVLAERDVLALFSCLGLGMSSFVIRLVWRNSQEARRFWRWYYSEAPRV